MMNPSLSVRAPDGEVRHGEGGGTAGVTGGRGDRILMSTGRGRAALIRVLQRAALTQGRRFKIQTGRKHTSGIYKLYVVNKKKGKHTLNCFNVICFVVS